MFKYRMLNKHVLSNWKYLHEMCVMLLVKSRLSGLINYFTLYQSYR